MTTMTATAHEACGTCLGSGTEAYSYGGHQWDIPVCRSCGGRGYIIRPRSKQETPDYVEPFDVQADWNERA